MSIFTDQGNGCDEHLNLFQKHWLLVFMVGNDLSLVKIFIKKFRNMNENKPGPQTTLWLLFLLGFAIQTLHAQSPLNRSVQVSVLTQESPPRFDFSWEWDWSAGDYSVYRKAPGAASWGIPVATLPWGSTAFTDQNVQVGVPYEYAFFKKKFENIVDTVIVPSGATLTFTFKNTYGDGICCNFGFGWYLVQVCGQTVAGGSNFGFEKSETFTVCSNGNPTQQLIITIHPDMQVNNSWWTLTNSAGVEIATSGPQGTPLDERPKYGFIQSGMKLPAIEARGSFLLVVDDLYAVPLAAEINQLEKDLIADGWKVIRRTAHRNDPVTEVKALIVNAYALHPDLKMVYLLGHVPVPYSGNIYPDGHSENHMGAWAADVYYGDVDGVWSDATVSNVSAQFDYNHNLPGDGKFDQSAIPSAVELAVGRVDLYNMPAFGLPDVELTRRYLQKAHLFKTGQRQAARRALVDDNLNQALASPAASGWRNFAPMFSAEQVYELDYFATMKNESYLWSYGGGGGTHYSAEGIGQTTDFVTDTLKNIFTMMTGSQFGDWDNMNNFLRAPLASPGWTLTNCWVGNPPFTFHHVAMGDPIGYSLVRSQNATEADYYPGPQLVHTSLLGDPSLRLHPVKPVTNLSVTEISGGKHLQWSPPPGETVAGYHVYRADSLHGTFLRLNSSIITVTSFTDWTLQGPGAVYMVRPVKLETSGSGTYWNLGLGEFVFFNMDPCAGSPFETEIFAEICEGTGYAIGDTVFTQPGDYQYGFITTNDCDSVVTVHLSVLPAIQVEIDTLFPPPGLEFYGNFYDQDTTVTLLLEGVNGCDTILTAHLQLAVTAIEKVETSTVSVWPNPVTGHFFIETKNTASDVGAALCDGTGRVFWRQYLHAGQMVKVDMEGLPAGVYFLKIRQMNSMTVRRVMLFT